MSRGQAMGLGAGLERGRLLGLDQNTLLDLGGEPEIRHTSFNPLTSDQSASGFAILRCQSRVDPFDQKQGRNTARVLHLE